MKVLSIPIGIVVNKPGAYTDRVKIARKVMRRVLGIKFQKPLYRNGVPA